MREQSIDRIAPTRRPDRRAAGYHSWRNLAFLHWQLPIEAVVGLIPPELTLDTWDGMAWIGLVPFSMENVRPWWSPPVPGLSYFRETNVRTYVHFRGQSPGVWFFSLEASNAIAVRLARWGWHLPYHYASMSLTRENHRVRYTSRRHWPGTEGAGCDVDISFGELRESPLDQATLPAGVSLPGTLEHFLVERYILYSQDQQKSIWSGHVHHPAYRIRHAELHSCTDTLIAAAGINVQGLPCHIAACDGVDVEVFALQRVSPE